MIHIIASLTQDRVIGRDGDQPWDIPEDRALFKQLTLGQTVIMGLNTYNTRALRRPLPERNNIVLSYEPLTLPGITVCTSIPDALLKAQELGKEIFVMGGASVYEQFLPLADYMHLSWLKESFGGTAYFPQFSVQDWTNVPKKDFEEFIYTEYKRKNA